MSAYVLCGKIGGVVRFVTYNILRGQRHPSVRLGWAHGYNPMVALAHLEYGGREAGQQAADGDHDRGLPELGRRAVESLQGQRRGQTEGVIRTTCQTNSCAPLETFMASTAQIKGNTSNGHK